MAIMVPRNVFGYVCWSEFVCVCVSGYVRSDVITGVAKKIQRRPKRDEVSSFVLLLESSRREGGGSFVVWARPLNEWNRVKLFGRDCALSQRRQSRLKSGGSWIRVKKIIFSRKFRFFRQFHKKKSIFRANFRKISIFDR